MDANRILGVHPLLMVADVTRTLAFYRQLGFCDKMQLLKNGQPYYAEVSVKSQAAEYLLMFLEREWWEPSADRDVSPVGVGLTVYLPVENLETAFENCRQLHEHHLIVPVTERYYGREFILSDEDGYRLAFFQPNPQGEVLGPNMQVWKQT
jgi:catechol 2,3-dioxygenase-like lactoylglutathione lyase family enzyme